MGGKILKSTSNNGHTCSSCGLWIPEGEGHSCYYVSTPVLQGYNCLYCGAWVPNGYFHVCSIPKPCTLTMCQFCTWANRCKKAPKPACFEEDK